MRSQWRELLEALAEELAELGPADGLFGTVEPMAEREDAEFREVPYKAAEGRRGQWGGEAFGDALRSGSGAGGISLRGSDLPEIGQESALSLSTGRDAFSFGKTKEKEGRRRSPDGGGDVQAELADEAYRAVEPRWGRLSFSARRKGEGGARFEGGIRPEQGAEAPFLPRQEGSAAARDTLPGGYARELDAEALDRAFQRDARRYDGGFPLY